MDAIDELLEPYLSENPHGKRNRRVLALSFVSAAVAVLIHSATLGDIETLAWQGVDSPDWPGGSVLLFFLAPVAIYFAVRKQESVLRYAAGALLIPLIALGVGLLNADNRRWQLEARDVFAAYTHRFPEGQLHGVYVPRQFERFVIVCANEGRQNPNNAPDDRQFCIETIVGRDRRGTVDGGYRFNADDGAEYGFGSHHFFDCFGAATECGSG